MSTPKQSPVTLSRVYRKLLALENQIALNRLDIEVQSAAITALRRALVPVVAHCERLLREKETLRAMIYPTAEEAKLREVNKFMAQPISHATTWNSYGPAVFGYGPEGAVWLPVRKCQFAHLHTVGVRCEVCGVTPWTLL